MKAITNGKIYTVTGPVYDKGTILFDEGKIIAVGEQVEIPEGTEVIDAEGGIVTPGLIDIHTHIGVFPGLNTMPGTSDGNEMSNPITPEVRAMDAINPDDISIEKTRKAGFTTVYTLPGSANLIGGTGIALKLRGKTADEMVIPGTENMKFAFGENPKRVYGSEHKMPVTRMGNAALIRKTLFEAKNYSDALLDYENGKGDKPKPDFRLDPLVPVVRGEMRCRMHAHRADDIMTAIRIGKEFHLDFSIEHCTNGWRIADVLAENNVPCMVGPMMMGPLKEEMWGEKLDMAAILDKAGVNICLIADMSYDTQWLPIKIGVAIREGLSWNTALEAVTIRPAKEMGLEKRLGSIEKGKDADFAIFNGDPFSNYTKCIHTIIDGKEWE
ncbi:MAG: amidohydrolase [Solobacterium sp.]|nr:amidohydrolase [Solobacterium sp.]